MLPKWSEKDGFCRKSNNYKTDLYPFKSSITQEMYQKSKNESVRIRKKPLYLRTPGIGYTSLREQLT